MLHYNIILQHIQVTFILTHHKTVKPALLSARYKHLIDTIKKISPPKNVINYILLSYKLYSAKNYAIMR